MKPVDDHPKVATLVTFSGPTCRAGRFEMRVSGPLTVKTLDNIIRQLEFYKAAIAEDETGAADLPEPNA